MIRFDADGNPEVYFDITPVEVRARKTIAMSLETFVAIARSAGSLEQLRTELLMTGQCPGKRVRPKAAGAKA